MSVCGIILAAGSSVRFGNENKLHMQIEGERVIEKSIRAFIESASVSSILVVGQEKCETFSDNKNIEWIDGGDTRYESLCTGLEWCMKNLLPDTKILVHNGANPWVTKREIESVIDLIQENVAVGVGHKVSGTVRAGKKDEYFRIDAAEKWEMQTPQGALLSDFLRWKECNTRQDITDELMLSECNGGSIRIIPASAENKKITYRGDIPKERYVNCTGFGIDSHRFEKEEKKDCMLCGVVIDSEYGFKANSDGDVALHALCNALLSGVGGDSFSALADHLCKSGVTDSTVYLKNVLKKVEEKNGKIDHVSLSFEGKYPKVERYFPIFRKILSDLLSVSAENIGLNATTGEGLDGYGRGEGMKVTAVCSLHVKRA